MTSITTTQPLRTRLRSRPEPRGTAVHTAVRWAAAAAFAARGVLLVLAERPMRGLEVHLSTAIAPYLFADEAKVAYASGDPAVFFRASGGWYALVVGAECSVAFSLAAICVLGGVLALVKRLSLVRVVGATAISMTGMVLLNQVRIVGLAFVRAEFGQETFDWAHSLGGSFLMMAGLAGSLALFFAFVVRRASRAER